MRKFALLIGTAMAATALVAGGAEATFYTTTEDTVKSACKGKMRSNDGAFGCTKVDTGGIVRDYSCNSNPKNGHLGCQVMDRTAPTPSKGPVTPGRATTR
jgi:hypothetical protein